MMLRARTYLLLLLLPLGAVWWWLSISVPMFGWGGLNAFHDGKRFSLSHHQERWQEFIVFDIQRRHYEFAKVPAAGQPSKKSTDVVTTGWTGASCWHRLVAGR